MSTDAIPAKEFDVAVEADRLGNCLARFAVVAKRMNAGMLQSPDAASHIERIIGAGRFNRAVTHAGNPDDVPEETVLYGKELLAARSSRNGGHNGLFAALAAIHHPLLALAQRMPIDLGKNGFTCEVQHDGETISIPLHELKMTFNKDAQIYTHGDISYGPRDAGGARKKLPANFLLLDDMYAEGYRRNPAGSLNCIIRDAEGKPLATELVTAILWMAMAGQGKNAFKGTGKENVQAVIGIDDMERANEFLVDNIRTLQRRHGYDPKPLWDDLVQSARDQLSPHTEALAIAREALAQRKADAPLPSSLKPPYIAAAMNPKTIDDVASFFQLPLPALADPQRTLARSIASGLYQAAAR